jgi:formylglycine-generating enzyme required for sulfatase activity
MRRIAACILIVLIAQPVLAQRKYNKTSTEKLPIYMTKVEGGSFDLGSNDEAADRKPAHTVKLKDFSLGTYEVTQHQWKAIMENNPSQFKCDECPVTNVDFAEVQDFIEKLNTKTGRHYRLPTEAEWEYAARGGVKEELVKRYKGVARGGVNEFLISDKGARVPDKDKEGKRFAGKKLAQDVAWYQRNSRDHVHCIGRKKPNEIGLYDMSGNVEEWVADWYANSYGSKNTVENPGGPTGGISHVVRGGSCASNEAELTVTRRAAYVPKTKANSLGFRLAE